MRKAAILILLLLIFSLMDAQEKFNADINRTTLSWLGEKILGKHTGTVKLKNGWLIWENDRIISGEFLVDMTSIKDDDSNARLEKHLKSDDFFGVGNFPLSKLLIKESTSFEKGTGVVKGDLTIKGITNPVEFKATIQKSDDGIWFFANIIVDRSRFDVRYGSGSFFSNLGDQTIYDEFKLKVNLLVR